HRRYPGRPGRTIDAPDRPSRQPRREHRVSAQADHGKTMEMTNAPPIVAALADQHPERALPCPHCAASVKGENLAKHIRKVHAADVGDALPTEWRGAYRNGRLIIVLPILFFIGGAAWLGLDPPAPEHDKIAMAILAGGFIVLALFAILVLSGRFG